MRAQTNETAATTRVPLRAAFVGIFGTLTLYLVLASNAQAKGAETVGKNLGDLIGAFGSYVTLGLAGIVALSMVLARKFSSIGALIVMVFLVMSLFVSGDEWTRLIENTMKVISKGV